MNPIVISAITYAGPPVAMFLFHLVGSFFKDKQHAATVQAVAAAGTNAAVAAAISGASPKQIGQAAIAAAIPVALPAAPTPTAGG